jgi:hypothetical protein
MHLDRTRWMVRWTLVTAVSLTLAAGMLSPSMAVAARNQSHTKTLIDWVSGNWQYRIRPPGGSGGAYVAGPAAFGSGGACSLQSRVMTNWPIDTTIGIRSGFRLPTHASNVQVLVAIDNDARVFVNGTEITDGWVIHEGCAERGSLTLVVPDDLLRFGGGNMVQVMGRDRGAESYLDASVTADLP